MRLEPSLATQVGHANRCARCPIAVAPHHCYCEAMGSDAPRSRLPYRAGKQPFYIEPDCCMLCGVPEDIAPELFETGGKHCALKRQPRTDSEIDKAIRAMWSSEVDCIRYSGSDEAILARLGEAGMSAYADDPKAGKFVALTRDSVNFTLPTGSIAAPSPATLAEMFRRDLRRDGTTVLPALLGRETVRLSWFRRIFHSVSFGPGEDARTMTAVLKSKSALMGLAWLVDDWLRSQKATAIIWRAKEGVGRDDEGRPTPI